MQDWAMRVIGLEIAMLAVLGVSFLYLEPGTSSYVVAKLTAGVILTTILGLGVIIYTGWEPDVE